MRNRVQPRKLFRRDFDISKDPDQIREFGGAAGIRDRGLLESAVAQASTTYDGGMREVQRGSNAGCARTGLDARDSQWPTGVFCEKARIPFQDYGRADADWSRRAADAMIAALPPPSNMPF
jgi:hypothetical protein